MVLAGAHPLVQTPVICFPGQTRVYFQEKNTIQIRFFSLAFSPFERQLIIQAGKAFLREVSQHGEGGALGTGCSPAKPDTQGPTHMASESGAALKEQTAKGYYGVTAESLATGKKGLDP